MSNAIGETAAAVRSYLRDHTDRATVRRYSFLLARWEQLKLAQHDGRTKPDDDARFREVSDMLLVATKKLGLGDTITGWNDFPPRDPQRLIFDSWLEPACMWFQ